MGIITTNILSSFITKGKTTNSNDDLQTIRKKKNRKDEAREIFKNMLDELSVSWKDTWEQALKTIINDPRYNETIRSTSERKALFIEWSKEKDKCEREEILRRRQNTRKEFLQLLEQSNILNIVNNYSGAEEHLGKEDRWNALECRGEREDVFNRFQNEKIKRENVERQNKILALKKYFETCEWLDFVTEWRKACCQLEE